MANVKIARVDFRLIHGQVIKKWIKYYPVDKININDDVLAADEFMKEIYGMAVPKGIEFDVLKIDEETEKLQKTDKNRVAYIWLDTNLKAHDFISAKYWKNNFQLVKEYVMIWSQK